MTRHVLRNYLIGQSTRRQRAVDWDPFPTVQHGEVTCNTMDKFVKLHWTGPKAPGKRFTRWAQDQIVDLTFYPIDFAVLQPSGDAWLAIGGLNDSGGSVLSVRHLGFATDQPPKLRSEEGEFTFSFHETSVAEESNLHADELQIYGTVNHLIPMQAPEHQDEILMQFAPSGEVHRFSTRSPLRSQLVASPTQPAGKLTAIPELALPHSRVWSATHLTEGDVYLFGHWRFGGTRLGKVDSPLRPPTVVLVDADRDGELDRAEVIPDRLWKRSTFNDPEAYGSDP